MKNTWKGFGSVFSFTFARHVGGDGWRRATVIVTLLCFLLPVGILCAVEKLSGAHSAEQTVSAVEQVYVIDETGGNAVEWDTLNRVGVAGFSHISYQVAEKAVLTANNLPEKALILLWQTEGDGQNVRVLLPENTTLHNSDAQDYQTFLEACFPLLQAQKAGLSAEQLTELMAPVQSQVVLADENDPLQTTRTIVGMIVPYLTLLLLYFLVLAYGQSVASCAIMEKTSKLMDFFLVTVRPAAMMLGKLLATALAGVLQSLLWVAGLGGGFACGIALVRLINPETTMGIVLLANSLGALDGMFSVPAVLAAVLMILGGFFLYCSLAAIGGALASKPEDLSVTNLLFTTLLIISFLSSMFAGGMNGMTSSASWLNWFPFTAVLVVPGRVLIGAVPVWQALVSFCLVALLIVTDTWVAGKLYRLMSLYKGNPVSPFKMLGMLKKKK